jgi:hypothetical protein
MAKPDFSNDMQTLAHRRDQLRALAADQKNEEGGEEPKEQKAASKKKAAKDKPTAARNEKAQAPASLSDAVEELIESDNPSRLTEDDREWSRRLTYISTRIPEDMRDLIDDLLFILKKEAKKDLGREPTLQDLACEAWGDLLGKYSERLSR